MVNLETLIAAGESRTLEFKEKVPSSSLRYLKTIVAFANGNGGKMIFGVNDETRDIVGMDDANIFRTVDSISDAIYNNIEPSVAAEISVQTVAKKSLIVAEIFPGAHAPYYIKSLGMEHGCFVRTSASTRIADKETIRELMFDGSGKSFDLTPQSHKEVSEKQIMALCRSMRDSAKKNCATEAEEKIVKSVSKNILLSWQIIQERKGKIVPTKAFDLLTDNSLWCAKIQCAVFKGKTRDIFIDRKEYAGSVQSQIEEAYEFVLRNIRLGAQIKGLHRKDVYEIPVEAIRELIVNAVVHRNYSEASHIQVSIFDDRLEITSPGGLPRSVTVEKMMSGYSKIRNEGLAKAFFYMKLIEHWGTGMPRIMSLLAEAGLPQAEIIDMDGALRINIYRIGDNRIVGDKSAINSKTGDKSAINVSKKDPKTLILEYLQTHEQASSKEFCELLGLKASRTKDYLNELEDAGKIESIGANKNRRYKLAGR